MSYSFSVRAATKGAAYEKIAAQFDQVVGSQRCHILDRDAAQATAFAFVGLLPDDETKDVQVSVNGSLGGTWQSDGSVTNLLHAHVSVQAALVIRAEG